MTIYNFSLLNIPFANGAPSNEISPFPDFDRGLGIAFDETDGKPEMKGLNGLFQQITMAAIYLKQRGIPEWDLNLEYPISAFVTKDGRLYKSKTQNTGKTPENSQSDWGVWASVSDITVSTNGNLKKTANANGSIHLEVPTATDAARGAMRFATPSEVVNKSITNAAITPSNASSIAHSTDIGIGQTWKNVIGSRSLGVSYTNASGKPIMISFGMSETEQSASLTARVNGVTVGVLSIKVNWSQSKSSSFIVPSNSSYRIDGIGISFWSELS